jgi:hypothetical protein
MGGSSVRCMAASSAGMTSSRSAAKSRRSPPEARVAGIELVASGLGPDLEGHLVGLVVVTLVAPGGHERAHPALVLAQAVGSLSPGAGLERLADLLLLRRQALVHPVRLLGRVLLRQLVLVEALGGVVVHVRHGLRPTHQPE